MGELWHEKRLIGDLHVGAQVDGKNAPNRNFGTKKRACKEHWKQNPLQVDQE